MSADLSSEALGEGGSLGEGGGHLSLKKQHRLGGLQSLAAAEPTEPSMLDANLVPTQQAPIVQHGAEGPDALHVPILAPMVLPDFGRLQSLAAAEPTEPQHWTPTLSGQTKLPSSSTAPRDRTPPDSR